MAVVEKMTPGGFFHGLPELFFDVFLLWDVGGNSKRLDCDDLPSWSFLGWKGGDLDTFWWRFSMHHTFIDQPDEGFRYDCEFGSALWYKQSKGGSASAPISNKVHSYKHHPEEELREGWTKHIGEQCGKAYFTHESTEDIPFRYPIPLSLQTTGDEATEKNFSRYLHFRTQRGWLNTGHLIKPISDDVHYMVDLEGGSIPLRTTPEPGRVLFAFTPKT